MSASDILMPFQAVFDFMRVPINMGPFTFNLLEFFIAVLTMTVVINAVWRFLDS